MKKLSKVIFKNVLGISEATIQPQDVNIISGAKGTGKTSFLDGIQVLLSNKCDRKQVIKSGENEATLYGELGNIVIDRKLRTEKSDAIKVTEDGSPVSSPQTFLNGLTDGLQFNPIKFYEADEKEQNKILLGLLEIPWTMEDIKHWFGEIPQGVKYDEHILSVLDQIQSKAGRYYLNREELGRQKRAKEAVINDIEKGLPSEFNISVKEIKLSEKYDAISKAEVVNGHITMAENLRLEHDNTIKAINDSGEAEKVAVSSKYQLENTRLSNSIRSNEDEINDLKVKISEIENQIALKNQTLKSNCEKEHVEKTSIDVLTFEKIETANAKLGEIIKYIDTHEKIDVEPMKEEAANIEHLQSFVREYERIDTIKGEIECLIGSVEQLTEKIEKARYLPGELLKTAKLPIDGLTVVDGAVLINGLPIGNLSDGEKLELSITIAEHKAGEVGIVLIDGFEKLNPTAQQEFIERCKKTNLQYFITNVQDGELEISTY